MEDFDEEPEIMVCHVETEVICDEEHSELARPCSVAGVLATWPGGPDSQARRRGTHGVPQFSHVHESEFAVEEEFGEVGLREYLAVVVREAEGERVAVGCTGGQEIRWRFAHDSACAGIQYDIS